MNLSPLHFSAQYRLLRGSTTRSEQSAWQTAISTLTTSFPGTGEVMKGESLQGITGSVDTGGRDEVTINTQFEQLLGNAQLKQGTHYTKS
jgi:hypothetical protein